MDPQFQRMKRMQHTQAIEGTLRFTKYGEGGVGECVISVDLDMVK